MVACADVNAPLGMLLRPAGAVRSELTLLSVPQTACRENVHGTQ